MAPGNTTPRIVISNVTKRFRRAGGKVIVPVDDISLTVDENELVVLLGPSGCGKTTLLRCVAGLERPDEGEISIDGRIVFSASRGIFIPPDQRQISMIFQSYALWPHMTVAQNVGYPLEGRKLSSAAIAERVGQALEMVGVGGLEGQYPGRISGGQQQRVALARALVSNSSVVMFDEPLSNVDAQVRSQLRFELKRMQRQIGFSGLYVTHDQTEAMELGHRVAVLQSGRIAALDTPRRVYEEPPNHYVANFVGVSNFLPGTVRSADGGSIVVEAAEGLFRVASGTAAYPAGAPVMLVLRPEKITLLPAQPRDVSENTVKVRIEAQLFSGDHTEYVVTIGDKTLRVWSHDDSLRNLSEGDPAWITVSPAALRLVPAAGAQA
ncbi:ABC transporter ATP-binding protein [Bosea sp. 685]|uniref:ABC transporter ATP-binding protein n=1 Tax=Bosea sp. 685 TaxID=3080057 RepID=UPI002892A214|nr:ABC transporter ATP-binding protein [Bosea sp. 685]WNJ88497.1 ABC transporter ATP-binding protein [Bosea sp. 685]